ncbi:hypothetical protein [Thiocapsa roseopersicina]|uniref:hypothetical protein n=1 Tax=Thiocapsa roseopersicina TaxID=1058 RepID=UPI001C31AED6|nr:hypothetical protein [Thiocapsa roseopersicina]
MFQLTPSPESRGSARSWLQGCSVSTTGKIQVVVEDGGGPDRTLLDATMAQGGRLAEVGLIAPLLEEQAKIGLQVRLVVFDGEDIVGAARGTLPVNFGSNGSVLLKQ